MSSLAHLTWHERRLRAAENLRECKRRRHRRLREARRIGSHTVAEWLALLAFCGGRCVACGVPPGTLRGAIQRDHILAISKGGSDSIENIQPMCVPCNSVKCDGEPFDLRPDGWRDAVASVVGGRRT